MTQSLTIQIRFRKMIIPVICTMIIMYFFIYGMRSIRDRSRLLEEISVLKQQYSLVHDRKLEIESHVGLLQPDHVNPDFLDEKSRETLGMMHRDEIIISN